MKQTEGLYSICCLSYNHGKFIKQAIESIIRQDYKNIEIIALDDGSSDNSADILKSLAKTAGVPMKVICQPNSGNVGANFNRLFAESSGQFVTFTSLDDRMIPDTFLKKINILKNDTSAAFVAPSLIKRIDESDNIDHKLCKSPVYGRHDLTPQVLLELLYQHTCDFYIQGAIFRRSIIEKCGGFDENQIADDLVLESRIFKYMENNPGLTFHILDEPGFYYRIHSSNSHKIKDRQLKSMITYYKEYWPDREPSPAFIKIVLESIGQRNINDIFNIFYMDEYMKNILCGNKQVQDAIAFAYERGSTQYGARYKKIELPLFRLEKYKDIDAGKKYFVINILGLRFSFSRKYTK